MTHIGIVGAGIAGLHLGIHLRTRDIETTIYADRSAAELSQGRLLNTVMHHHATLERERRLGINHWDAEAAGWRHRRQYVGDPTPIQYTAPLPGASMAIDYRVYLPALMRDFEDLGGKLEARLVHVDEIDRLSSRHDLVAVATRLGGMPLLFPIRDDLPPVGVKRRLLAVLVDGVSRPIPEGVTLSSARGVGELIEIPMLTAEGMATALLFESLPGGPGDARLTTHGADDLEALQRTILQVLHDHYPASAERVDSASLKIRSPRDVFTGAIAPAVRHGSTYLPSGGLAVALGDAHVLLDPLVGQGANIAAYSAERLADAIAADLDYDDQFRRRLEVDREPLLLAAYAWTNLELAGASHLRLIHHAAAADPALACDFASRYADPRRMWEVVGTRTRTLNYLQQFGHEPTIAARHD